MKLCKYLIILICISLLTGCTFEYNVTINKEFINEEGNVLNYDKSTWNEQNYLGTDKTYFEIINDALKTYEKVYRSDEESYINPYEKNDEYEYYNTKLISNNDMYGIKYYYTEEIEKYYDTRIINMCYDNVDINNNSNITIKTSNEFICFDYYDKLDEVIVNIKVSEDYRIVNSNADKKENGIHTWIITPDNASNKPIQIELGVEVEEAFNWNLLFIILLPILIVIVIICLILRNKLRKNNQI